MSAFARVAYIVSARNLDGSVVCQSADSAPFLLERGQLVHFVPPTLRGPRSARVMSVAPMRQGNYDVVFSGVEGRSAAEELVGSYCLVSKDELTSEGAQDRADTRAGLKGFSVSDATFGDLGCVDEVLENSAQTTLVVSNGENEVLIPLVDDFICAVDEASGTITTRIPEGLLHLNERTQ